MCFSIRVPVMFISSVGLITVTEIKHSHLALSRLDRQVSTSVQRKKHTF